MTSSHLYEDDNELDLDDEILSKFNKMDNDSDSDQDTLKNNRPVASNAKSTGSKILVKVIDYSLFLIINNILNNFNFFKKNAPKKIEKQTKRNPFLENDDDEQDSVENKLRVIIKMKSNILKILNNQIFKKGAERRKWPFSKITS